jgi:hypothetical protein
MEQAATSNFRSGAVPRGPRVALLTEIRVAQSMSSIKQKYPFWTYFRNGYLFLQQAAIARRQLTN